MWGWHGSGPRPAAAPRRRATRPRCPCAASLARGKSGMRGTFRPLRSSFRRSPLAPWRSPLARARPRSGLRRAFAPSVPAVALWLRLSGRAAPAPSGPLLPPAALAAPRLRPRRLGPARFARGASGRPWAAPGVALRAAAGSLCPRGLLAASGPPSRVRAAPGCAALALGGSGPGALGGCRRLGRLRPPGLGVGFRRLRAAGKTICGGAAVAAPPHMGRVMYA